MKLSILILTHNRPTLFQRCITSVLPCLRDGVEVFVNNDSKDIEPYQHPAIQYSYDRFEHLSDVYKHLLDKATGEYVYFLEDDDYLLCNMLEQIDPHADLIVGNYYPTYPTPHKLTFPRLYKDRMMAPEQFLKELNEEHLQLSQHIYKRSLLNDFVFPKDSNIHNDILLTKHAAVNSKAIRTTSKLFYCQTIDGKDNISFAETNYGHAV